VTADSRLGAPLDASAPIAGFRQVRACRPAGVQGSVPPLVSASAEALCRGGGEGRGRRRTPRAQRLAPAATGRVPWTL